MYRCYHDPVRERDRVANNKLFWKETKQLFLLKHFALLRFQGVCIQDILRQLDDVT